MCKLFNAAILASCIFNTNPGDLFILFIYGVVALYGIVTYMHGGGGV